MEEKILPYLFSALGVLLAFTAMLKSFITLAHKKRQEKFIIQSFEKKDGLVAIIKAYEVLLKSTENLGTHKLDDKVLEEITAAKYKILKEMDGELKKLLKNKEIITSEAAISKDETIRYRYFDRLLEKIEIDISEPVGI